MRGYLTQLLSTEVATAGDQYGIAGSAHAWLHVTSDLATFVAFMTISGVLAYLAWRRKNLPFRWLVLWFAAVILITGVAHLLNSLMFAASAYRLEWAVKLSTAVIAWATVIALVVVVPKVLTLKTPKELQREADELRRAQHALLESEAIYASLVDSLPLNMFRKDLQGRMVYANKRYCEMLKTDMERLKYKTDRELFPEEQARKYVEDDIRVITTGEVIEDVEVHVKPDGTRIYVQVLKAPVIDSEGNTVGLQGLFWDVTAKQEAEEDLRKAMEAAESASHSKSIFLANMSHEIRTPLNGVIGLTELLLDTDLTNQQRESLRMIRDSGESLLTVINDILDFSKIEVGKLTLDQEAFDFRESLGDTMKSLAFRAHAKGLEIAYEVAHDIPSMLIGDRHRLRQVVVNIVGNAIKFTNQGEVFLSVDKSSASDNQVELHFAVADTGMGVAKDKLDSIFHAFEQADGSTTRRHGGTGLGLAIASNLVELMDGRVWVESELNVGTTMHFTARFDLVPEAEPATPLIEAKQVHDLRVLVVDDNQTNRRILSHSFQSWHMRPTAVVTGEEALEQLAEAQRQADPFRLVLCDADMPGMDGFELVDRIVKSNEIETIVLMMLTSANQFEDTARCEKLGLSFYLIKPIKQSDLFDAMVMALGIKSVGHAAQPDEPRIPELRPLHILLAEDSPVNQRLAVGLLHKFGHRVTVVENGKLAVDAIRDRQFDLVLMDVQMPEMDGLEATEVIRTRENRTGQHVPIVGMTAHAMKGDRDRCIEAGMDDYVPNPVRASNLMNAIASAVAPTNARETDGEEPCADYQAPQSAEPIDWSHARRAMLGDEQLLEEVADTFLEELPRMMTAIHSAAASNNHVELRRAAHTLKGSLGHFGARVARDLAFRLEVMGESGDTSRVDESLKALDGAMALVKPALEDFLEQTKAKRTGHAEVGPGGPTP